MVKNTAEQIVPCEVDGPRCGTPGQAAKFLDSVLLHWK
jgi:hypothetical protein